MFAFLFPAAKAETPVRIKSLADLEAGEIGRVMEITTEEPLALHILEIGLVNGAKVRYLRSAPLGDPIQVEVDGFLLSLRKNEAEAVIVEIQE
jgi:Fe2+ transport system protein FeoA